MRWQRQHCKQKKKKEKENKELSTKHQIKCKKSDWRDALWKAEGSALPDPYMVLGKSPNVSGPQFLICKMGVIVLVAISHGSGD